MSTFEPAAALRGFEYALVDVFAERPLEGNMLAIFTDGRGLSTEEMQALARDMNLSETTFILPRDEATERELGVQVRIFTTQEELEFAGHPTLGTASWLFWHHPVLRGAGTLTLDLKVGRVPVAFAAEQAGPGVYGTMRQRDPVFGQVHDRAQVAAALGLGVEDLDAALAPQTVSTGLAFCIVPLRSMDAAARLRIPQAAAQAYLEATDAKFFYCVAPAPPDSGADWHARMQFYNGEDPATGSAGGCAVAYLVRHGAVGIGVEVILEQGVEMLRPSRIYVRATAGAEPGNPDRIVDVFVGGRTIPVASGRFFLP
jgi:trans-2,3-dihydro-3-hydroxyanthranilate isomerase